MSREWRVDKLSFGSKEEAVKFGVENGLNEHNLYLSVDGVYLVKRFTKQKGDTKIGVFITGKDKKITYSDLKTPVTYEKTYKRKSALRDIDGKKLADFIYKNGYSKIELCNLVHRSRVFINDAVRYNKMEPLCLEKICEYFKVSLNFFDPKKEEEIIEETEENVINNDILHDDLMALITSNKKIELLLQELINIWTK